MRLWQRHSHVVYDRWSFRLELLLYIEVLYLYRKLLEKARVRGVFVLLYNDRVFFTLI